MIKRFFALAAFLLPLLAWGQACDFWQRITFADGKVACTSDYLFAQASPVGFSVPLTSVIPRSSRFSVAATAWPPAACPLTMAITIADAQAGPGAAERRDATSLGSCRAAVRRPARSAACDCELMLVDGRSPLTKDQFDARYARTAAAASLQPRPTAQASAPSAPAARNDAEQVRTQELLVAMQKRLAELEATRPASPGAAVGVAPLTSRPVKPRLSARALVIGNSRYESFGALANPVRDAKAIAAKLESYGIPVDLVLDAQRDDLIHALNEHMRKASGKDVSILFYAGHGVQVEGTNYIIPVNMRATGITSGYVKLAGISLNAALDYLPARTRIVFLDACRDNAASRTLVGTRSASSAGLAPVNAASGTLVAYATRDGATADDGDGQNSPYTTALLRHMDTPADISLVLRQVRQTVLDLTSGRQEPWEYGSLIGEEIVLPLLR